MVSPLGLSVAETWEGLLAGRSGAAPIQRFDPSNLDVRFGCEVKNFDPLTYVDRKEAKRYDLFLQYAIAAADQAVADAGLDGVGTPAERTGVIVGSGIGGIMTFEEQCKLYLTHGPNRVSPFFVPMFIPDIAAGVISIRLGAKGPNFCTVSACASSAHALGESFRLIQAGEADLMVTGGAEAAITPLAIAGFSNMKALSTRNDAPQHASRPFDRERDGFVMGDGAAIIVLEALEHATARGARIYGELVGYGMSADAYHITRRR
jgi:3-oxoacyl-[acyl-carrier-protein] synthase II